MEKHKIKQSRKGCMMGIFLTLAVLCSWVLVRELPKVARSPCKVFRSKKLFHDARIERRRRTSETLYELLSDSRDTYYDEEAWVVGTSFFSENTYSRQPYVANGYLGSRIPNVGFGYALDTYNIWTPDASIPGSLDNGWPLRNRRFAGAFVSDFYGLEPKFNSTNFPELDEKGYNSVLCAIPQWTDIKFSIKNDTFQFNAQSVNPSQISNYQQNLSLLTGTVTTEMDWLDVLHIKSSVFAHRIRHPLGTVQLEISLIPNNPEQLEVIDLQLSDVLNHSTSRRTFLRDIGYDSGGIYMEVEPNNVPYSSAALYSSLKISSAETNIDGVVFQLNDGGTSVTCKHLLQLTSDNSTVTINKFVGIVSSEYDRYNKAMSNLDAAKDVVRYTQTESYESLAEGHQQEWIKLYDNASIEIPSDSLLELAARSSLFHLLANTRRFNVSQERGLPVPASGLSSDSYAGLVFWDADLWIMPSLLPFFPDISKHMVTYRQSTHNQAKINAQENGYPGALYPWTSGRFANCTSTGPCVDYEYHINIDVAMASFLVYLNGADGIDDNYLRGTTWPLVRDAALFFSSYVDYNPALDAYETHNMTDPDEYANFISNGAFTNAGIRTLLKWATDIGHHLNESVDPKWADVSKKIVIPISDTNITLEYSGMNASVEIKQADVMLMTYPLGYITDETILDNAIRNLYYYSERQSASGPAMTYPVFVAAAAGLLNHGCSSQSYLYKSVLPYLRAPFVQFSEQSDDNFLTNGLTQPAFPFLTGNGGYLQSLLFGLTGLRYSYESNKTTGQITRLLKFNPIKLPLLAGGITIRNFKYMGQVLDVEIGDENATLVHKAGDQPIRLKLLNRNVIHDRELGRFDSSHVHELKQLPVRHAILEPGRNLTVKLFRPLLNIDNNLAEGKQVTNFTTGVPGDVIYSVTDGNNYTHWQPLHKCDCAKILIDLGADNEQTLTGGMIMWGKRPAQNISVSMFPFHGSIEEALFNASAIIEMSGPETETEIMGFKGAASDVKLKLKETKENCFEEDYQYLMQSQRLDIGQLSKISPESSLLKSKFVTILRDQKVSPSVPYIENDENKDRIMIPQSNTTQFTFDYSYYSNHSCAADWPPPRFVLVHVQGTYDNDDDPRGATIKEIALM
ncbi:LANO_0F12442g1_1 [Lachancea nothofagi CBS 11611]|uniref:alpha,alpha-trehalase n=1 Tax=Lachancea nothofagi CBS 11611 TaxID=1266666 RepID=A0A1G4KBA3_9SACH|nr:LANO_0F12442g1_1 [Lachancea nothofagi CBS 11611]